MDDVGGIPRKPEAVSRPVFGLIATGNSLIGCSFKMHSKDLFATRAGAEGHKPEFKIRCCDPKHINCAEEDTIKIDIIEYEMHEL